MKFLCSEFLVRIYFVFALLLIELSVKLKCLELVLLIFRKLHVQVTVIICFRLLKLTYSSVTKVLNYQ